MSSGFKAEAGRYHLYVSLACPWAHRTLIVRSLKGLEDMISVSVVHWLMLENGWTFRTTQPTRSYERRFRLAGLYVSIQALYPRWKRFDLLSEMLSAISLSPVLTVGSSVSSLPPVPASELTSTSPVPTFREPPLAKEHLEVNAPDRLHLLVLSRSKLNSR